MNVVAVGVSWDPDSGGLGNIPLIVRTFDAGKSWQKQNLGPAGAVRDVHFSDSITGIALVQDNFDPGVGVGPVYTYTTTNGGRKWVQRSLYEFNPNLPIGIKFTQCFSYATGATRQGEFKIFKSWKGAIYETADTWQTVVTTLPISNSSTDPNGNLKLFNCSFSRDDVLIAYGMYGAFNSVTQGLMMRSADGGKSWGDPILFPGVVSSVSGMTPIDRDTIFAWGNSTNKIFISNDRGITWRTDSLLLDTMYAQSAILGMDIAAGHPIAIYGIGMTAPSILIRGEGQRSSVKANESNANGLNFFPNPASTHASLHFTLVKSCSASIEIYDLLGRRMKQISLGEMSAGEHSQEMDLRGLSDGSYLCKMQAGGEVTSKMFTILK